MKTIISTLLALALISSSIDARDLSQEVLLRAMRRNAQRKTEQQSDKILGGEDATLGQFPWQASMDMNFNGHICGASILSEKFIVTAAHCIDAVNNNPNSFVMRVGLVDLNSNTDVKATVKTIYQHENWDPFQIVNDIALVELTNPLTFNANVQPITLGVGMTPSPNEFACVASGWGATDGNGFFYPDDLQFLDLTFYSDSRCRGHWEPVGVQYSDNSHMCAGKANGDSVCFGDSGGPLVCEAVEDGQRYLFGATSFGNNPCGQVQYPAVWTDLVNFIDWIEDITGPLPRPMI